MYDDLNSLQRRRAELVYDLSARSSSRHKRSLTGAPIMSCNEQLVTLNDISVGGVLPWISLDYYYYFIITQGFQSAATLIPLYS